MDSLDIAIYRVAHDYPGGVPALAKRINAKPGTLFNKVNPEMEHALNVYELRAITLATGDERALAALAHDCGFGLFELGDWSNCSDHELIERITALGAARGDVDRAIHQALADGVITAEELDRIKGHMRAAIRANLEVLTRLAALCEAEEARSHG